MPYSVSFFCERLTWGTLSNFWAAFCGPYYRYLLKINKKIWDRNSARAAVCADRLGELRGYQSTASLLQPSEDQGLRQSELKTAKASDRARGSNTPCSPRQVCGVGGGFNRFVQTAGPSWEDRGLCWLFRRVAGGITKRGQRTGENENGKTKRVISRWFVVGHGS